VTLGDVEMPALASGKLRAEFPADSEGPQGSGLLRLLYGVVGEPLPPDAVQFGARIDEEVRKAMAAIEAARNIGTGKLLELAGTASVAWLSTPALRCFVAECLIKRKDNAEALTVLASVLEDFPSSIRARQLQGVALARSGQIDDAQMVLGQLHAEGNLDPETLSIYARVWMDRYKQSGNRLHLAKSRSLYLRVFELVPSDSYVGINGTSKSVMLGEMDLAADLAARVEKLVGTDEHPTDYWKTATAAEAQVIKRNYAVAAKLYDKAVLASPEDRGSHESMAGQAMLLMDCLGTPPAERRAIEAVFAHLKEPAAAGGH
jgi:Flp pilus assembly protein TadD